MLEAHLGFQTPPEEPSGALLRLLVALLDDMDGLHLALLDRPLEMLCIEIKISFILVGILTQYFAYFFD